MKTNDGDFCSHCGLILPMVTKAPVSIECFNCKVVRNVKECNKVVSVLHYNYDQKLAELKESDGKDEEHGSEVDHLCSRCGHNKATYSTQQTRSADEGQTVFYTCLKCKKRDIEYS